MAKPKQLKIRSTVIRHHPQFSRLVTIPKEKVSPWKLEQTTVVEGTINGISLGRRSLKRWDDRNCWWIDLPEPLCKKASIDTGDLVEIHIQLASEQLPDELQKLLSDNKAAKVRWDKMTTAQQRMLREEVYAAKQPEARLRRAAKYLL
jgi:hypothetical protein